MRPTKTSAWPRTCGAALRIEDAVGEEIAAGHEHLVDQRARIRVRLFEIAHQLRRHRVGEVDRELAAVAGLHDESFIAGIEARDVAPDGVRKRKPQLVHKPLSLAGPALLLGRVVQFGLAGFSQHHEDSTLGVGHGNSLRVGCDDESALASERLFLSGTQNSIALH